MNKRDKIMKRIVYTTVHQIISFYLILLLAQMLSILKSVECIVRIVVVGAQIFMVHIVDVILWYPKERI